jgi:phospholipid/cholesterol/gamma-HCH transport system ATP-binding protein
MMNPLVEVLDFKKSYGSKTVHKGVNFDLRKGEIVCLLGQSGSGKSVFLRALIGLEKPDSGTMRYKGQDMSSYSQEDWFNVRKEIAYAFQNGALFDSFTVEENLLYPLDAHTTLSRVQKKKRVKEILELIGLEGTENLLPSDLSGGMQKRAGLARAIILDPEIILYDEPTAGLDPLNTRVIQEIMLDLKKRGKSGILVTHDMPTAIAVSERISLLKDGKIIVSGTVSEVRKDKRIEEFMTGVTNGSTER